MVVPGCLEERQRAVSGLIDEAALFISSEFVRAGGDARYSVVDPSYGEVVGSIVDADAEAVDEAVGSARQAFESGAWSTVSPRDRGRLLLRVAQEIDGDRDQLALLEHIDTGKPMSAALSEIDRIVDYLEYYAGWPTKVAGSLPASSLAGHTAMVRSQPRGVVAAIVPWNFPLRIAVWKLAPALAAGCTVVVKPPEEASLATLRLGHVLQAADLPRGAVNVVTGRGATVGAALAAHDDVDMITFTGSRAVGATIMAASAGSNLKKTHLELGGKNATIVFADADLEAAARAAVLSITINAGQVCTSGSRVLVEEAAHEEFAQRVSQLASQVRLCRPDLGTTEMGPLITATQLRTVERLVREGVEAGAAPITGGRRAEEAGLQEGFFYRPTVLDGVTATMPIAQEEIFGPVMTVETFDSQATAISTANRTRYGLAAGVWTGDLVRGLGVADRLTVGTVWLNTNYAADEAVPAGGWKESGNGREHGYSGIAEYLHDKTVWVGHHA